MNSMNADRRSRATYSLVDAALEGSFSDHYSKLTLHQAVPAALLHKGGIQLIGLFVRDVARSTRSERGRFTKISAHEEPHATKVPLLASKTYLRQLEVECVGRGLLNRAASCVSK